MRRSPSSWPPSRLASPASFPSPRTWTKTRDSDRAAAIDQPGRIRGVEGFDEPRRQGDFLKVHDFAASGRPWSRTAGRCRPATWPLEPRRGWFPGGQAAERLPDAGIRAVIVDVHEGEGVARRRGWKSEVEADGGDRQFDRLTDGDGHLPGTGFVGCRDRLEPDGRAGGSELAEGTLAIRDRAETHALQAAAAAAGSLADRAGGDQTRAE